MQEFHAPAAIERLRSAGCTQKIAEAVVDEISRVAIDDNVATKSDVRDLQVQIKEFRAEFTEKLAHVETERVKDTADVKSDLTDKISNVRTELTNKIDHFRTELKQEIADVKSELKQEITDVKIELTNKIDTNTSKIETLSRDIQVLSSSVQISSNNTRWLIWGMSAVTALSIGIIVKLFIG